MSDQNFGPECIPKTYLPFSKSKPDGLVFSLILVILTAETKLIKQGGITI